MASEGAGTLAAANILYDLIPGYLKLSGRMGMVLEMAMFRRFGMLNA